MPRRPRLEAEPFPPIESLIPHRAPACLLERVLERAGDGLVAQAVVPRDSPATLALEMAAQAAAALAALERRGQGEPRPGYLVGARNAAFHRPWIAAGEPLRVTVTPAGSAPPLAVYEFTVHAGETLLASGTISTYLL